MMDHIKIGQRLIGQGYPTFIIAEISANHHQQYDEAVKLIEAAKEAGADAVKLQTYTSDTMTIRCDGPEFRISGGTPWDGKTLYDLYQESYMPWEWQPKLKNVADKLEISLLSTPYDKTAVDFLEDMGVPVYKVASFEIVDIPLIKYIAGKGKPMIISTGMATREEIKEAVQTARDGGAFEIALLKCTSAYPALPEEMNLRTIQLISEEFGVPAGLSDHSLEIAVPVAAVTLGACIIEKHFILSRNRIGPDSAFSLEPKEFKEMVTAIRTVEKALGAESYELSKREADNRVFRRSLFVVKDVKAGETFNEENVRSIRPGHGLPPDQINDVIGQRAAKDIKAGTPLSRDLIS